MHRLRAAFVAGTVLLGLGASGGRAEANAATAATPSDFQGVYRIVGGDQKKEQIRRIVDVATEDMSVLLRGIARDRLYETTEPLSVLVLDFPGEKISVGYFGETAIVSPNDGTRVKWQNRFGDKTKVGQTITNSKLVQHFSGASGGKRKSVYTLSEDGSKISVQTTVTATLLPKPVKFRVIYRRR